MTLPRLRFPRRGFFFGNNLLIPARFVSRCYNARILRRTTTILKAAFVCGSICGRGRVKGGGKWARSSSSALLLVRKSRQVSKWISRRSSNWSYRRSTARSADSLTKWRGSNIGWRLSRPKHKMRPLKQLSKRSLDWQTASGSLGPFPFYRVASALQPPICRIGVSWLLRVGPRPDRSQPCD
jgi:hypothetical protein